LVNVQFSYMEIKLSVLHAIVLSWKSISDSVLVSCLKDGCQVAMSELYETKKKYSSVWPFYTYHWKYKDSSNNLDSEENFCCLWIDRRIYVFRYGTQMLYTSKNLQKLYPKVAWAAWRCRLHSSFYLWSRKVNGADFLYIHFELKLVWMRKLD
jgi:hypothetical protein